MDEPKNRFCWSWHDLNGHCELPEGHRGPHARCHGSNDKHNEWPNPERPWVDDAAEGGTNFETLKLDMECALDDVRSAYLLTRETSEAIIAADLPEEVEEKLLLRLNAIESCLRSAEDMLEVDGEAEEEPQS